MLDEAVMIENNFVQIQGGSISRSEIKAGMEIQTFEGLKRVAGIRKLQAPIYRVVYAGEHWTHMAVTLTAGCELKSFDKDQWIAPAELQHGQRMANGGALPVVVIESSEIRAQGLADIIDVEGREFYLGDLRYRPAAQQCAVANV